MTDLNDEIQMYTDWITQLLEESPLTLYPTPLGQTEVDQQYEIMMDLAYQASLEVSSDPDDLIDCPLGQDSTVVIDNDKYIALLEKIVYNIYSDFNTFVQYVALGYALRHTTTVKNQLINKYGIDPELIEAVGNAGENCIKMFIRAFSRATDLTSLELYTNDYNVNGVINFYNQLPQRIKDMMEADMENMLIETYHVEQS